VLGDEPHRHSPPARYRITIERSADAGGRFALTIAGLDSARIQSDNCATLVELGVHTVHASAVDRSTLESSTLDRSSVGSPAGNTPTQDTPARNTPARPTRDRATRDRPTGEASPGHTGDHAGVYDVPAIAVERSPSFELGIAASTVVNPLAADGYSLLGAQGSRKFGAFNVLASASWVLPVRMVSTLQTENNGLVAVSGWSAGTDVCWMNSEALHFCALAVVRRLSVEPREDFQTTATNRVLVGLGASFISAATNHLRLHAQPAVLVSTLGAQQVRWAGLEREIYEHPAVELQLRATVAWSFERVPQWH
jgi:hypothetical protein